MSVNGSKLKTGGCEKKMSEYKSGGSFNCRNIPEKEKCNGKSWTWVCTTSGREYICRGICSIGKKCMNYSLNGKTRREFLWISIPKSFKN